MSESSDFDITKQPGIADENDQERCSEEISTPRKECLCCHDEPKPLRWLLHGLKPPKTAPLHEKERGMLRGQEYGTVLPGVFGELEEMILKRHKETYEIMKWVRSQAF